MERRTRVPGTKPVVNVTRRDWLILAGGLAAGCAGSPAPPRAAALPPFEPAQRAPVRAVAFDAFVLFDPRPFLRKLEAAFPGRGAEVASDFRVRLFEYGWLRALGRRYRDFWALSQDALDAAAETQRLPLPTALRASLLEAWDSLPAWPDAVAGVRMLSERGLALAVLSNWSPGMLDRALARSGLDSVVRALSTDVARTYKPDPLAYALAIESFGVRKDEVAFVAFAAWDAAGASWFGFPTVWMNRLGAQRERLGMREVAVVSSFADARLRSILLGSALVEDSA